MLDLDVILMWLGLFSAVVLLASGRGGLWAAKAVVLILLAVAGVLLRPLLAGWIVGAVWLAIIVLPALLIRLADARMLAQRYASALWLYAAAGLLHPDASARGRIATLRALLMARRGAFAAAIARLDRVARDRRTARPFAASALMHQRRLEGRLDTLLDEVDWAGEEAGSAAMLRLRVLAMLGRVTDLVAVQAEHGWRVRDLRAGAPAIWGIGLLWLFSATGRVDALRRLLAGPLRRLPAPVRAFHVAAAQMAAGSDSAAARATLAKLAGSRDRDVAQAASRILAAGPAPVLLTPGDAAVVAAAEADLDAWLSARALAPRLRRSPLTLALILLNLAAFAAELARGGSEDTQTLLRLGALWPPYVLRLGQWWRVGAASFLHLGWVHLGMNMLALAVLGTTVERTLGWWRMLLTYAVAGLGAMTGIVLLVRQGWMGEEMVVGASGAIMGLVGALLAQAAREWWRERSHTARRRLLWVLGIVALQSALDVATPQVSFAGHALGAAFGFVVAMALSAGRRRPAIAAPEPIAVRGMASAGEGVRLPRRRLAVASVAVVVAAAAALEYPQRREQAEARAAAAAATAARLEVTPLQVAAMRRLRFVFIDFIEAGAPAVEPMRPFGSADALADLAAVSGLASLSALRALFIEVMRALPEFCASARLEPGSYAVDGQNVTVSSEQARLVGRLAWRVPPFEEEGIVPGRASGGWPVDLVDPKRPYGDMTYFEADMADELGIPVGRDAHGYAHLGDDAIRYLDALHVTMAGVLRAFVVHARLD